MHSKYGFKYELENFTQYILKIWDDSRLR